jgi:hypothetical protein
VDCPGVDSQGGGKKIVSSWDTFILALRNTLKRLRVKIDVTAILVWENHTIWNTSSASCLTAYKCTFFFSFFSTWRGWQIQSPKFGIFSPKRWALSVGKPRPRWKDFVRRDTTEILGIRGWRIRAEGREEWRRLLRDTRAPEGGVALQVDGWIGTVKNMWVYYNISSCDSAEVQVM